MLPAAFVLAYLFAGGVTMAGSGRVAGAGWLALHLVLLGAVTNAIVVWSEQFAAALLRTPASSERAALARVLALNLAVLAVLAGVHVGRPALTVAGAGLLAVVVVAHARSLTTSIRRSLAARLGGTVWFISRPAGRCSPASGLGCSWPAAPPARPTPTGRSGWPTRTSPCSVGWAWRCSAPSSPCGRPCCAPAWCPGYPPWSTRCCC